MRIILSLAIAALGASCATAPPMVWLRTDGQHLSGNAALTQQFEIDRTICQGELQKANASGVVVTNGGLAGVVAAQNRAEAVSDVGRGCMAQKGYLQVPADQADATSISLAATAAQRGQAPAPPQTASRR